MTISEILVLDDGWMTEKEAHDLGTWYIENTPLKDPIAIEAHWMTLRVGALLREAGRPPDERVTPARFVLLRDLYRAAGSSLSMTAISRHMNVTMTNVTKLVDGLVQLGLVKRAGDESDKRKTMACLTREGLALIEQVMPRSALQIEEAWSTLSAHEKRMLVHLLAKVKLQAHLVAGVAGPTTPEGID